MGGATVLYYSVGPATRWVVDSAFALARGRPAPTAAELEGARFAVDVHSECAAAYADVPAHLSSVLHNTAGRLARATRARDPDALRAETRRYQAQARMVHDLMRTRQSAPSNTRP